MRCLSGTLGFRVLDELLDTGYGDMVHDVKYESSYSDGA